HRMAAAELYRELIDAPRAAAAFEPNLSVVAALNLLAAGQTEDAATIVRELVKNHSSDEIALAGKSTPLPAASADPVAWLYSVAGHPQSTASQVSNWLTLRGDAARNAQAGGGQPHLRPRWEARVVNEPSVESYLTARSDDNIQRGVVAIPA